MIYEIRNYHFDPALFSAYKTWAVNEAIPHLAAKLDLVGFWVNTSDSPEVLGQPLEDRHAHIHYTLGDTDLV